ncbi:MAG: hypothetical protein OXE77_11040 [Flavobacteriaceae bacterium]|nr:hypothetical protein [Flavobacteriaceae bacterium]MCY4162382.1 hypothetical protein [Flavobacteriaceae bacterium]MCY4266788.1 hypothetical protein [Flavobacteriaceae bacterium]MCY4268133.1 hypothetical protein [Flavobacteriaceae bacterium]
MRFSIQNIRSSGSLMPWIGLFLKTPLVPLIPQRAVQPSRDGGLLDAETS